MENDPLFLCARSYCFLNGFQELRCKLEWKNLFMVLYSSFCAFLQNMINAVAYF